MTSNFALPMLRPMAVKGVPLGDAAIVLMFVVAAVAMAAIGVPPLGDKGIALAFGAIAAVDYSSGIDVRRRRGRSLQHRSVARRELGLIKLRKY